jgi:uncharacterized membrane-anchored protein
MAIEMSELMKFGALVVTFFLVLGIVCLCDTVVNDYMESPYVFRRWFKENKRQLIRDGVVILMAILMSAISFTKLFFMI